MIEIQTWQVIDETAFSKLVSETYNTPYQAQQSGLDYPAFLDQGSIHHITVPYTVSSEDEKKFQEWLEERMDIDTANIDWSRKLTLERTWVPVQPILNDLHKRGLLPEGKFCLHVWW